MRLEQLEHIIEIEKQKSISKAAKSLYMGQSSLSCSLTSLEEELGVKLFERSASGAIPTGEGKKALQLAHQMLDIKKQLLDLSENEAELRGTVTLLADHGYGYFLKDIMLNFKQRYPKAELILKVGTPHEVFYALLEKNYNVVLALLTTELKEKVLTIRKQNICYESFGEYPFMIFVQKDGRYKEKTAITVDELRKEQVLLNSSEIWNIVFPDITLEKGPLVLTDRDLLRQMIVDNEGVALLPAMFAKNALHSDADSVKVIMIDSPNPVPKGEALLLHLEKKALTQLEQGLLVVIKETMHM